jgi:hypothetical protein
LCSGVCIRAAKPSCFGNTQLLVKRNASQGVCDYSMPGKAAIRTLDQEKSVTPWRCGRVLGSHGQRRLSLAMIAVGMVRQ